MPEWILDSIIGLCKEKIEYSGQLLCYGNIVEYPYISGVGDVGSVVSKKKIVFDHPEVYRAIEFHTHPEALGEYWSTRFSDGDIRTFNNRLWQESSEYKHALFTSRHILTWGKDIAPEVRIGFGSYETVAHT